MKNKFLYSIGNRKLGKDTLVFNLTSATDCPSKALKLCGHPGKCYAMKAERLYPACLPYRRRQAQYWHKTPARTIAWDIKDALARHKAVKFIRFSESGDFRAQKDVDKLYFIASLVPDAVFYGYTARRDLQFQNPKPRNLIINGSGFMIDNKYTATAEYTKGASRCSENVCANCMLCKTRGKKIIENLFH